MKRNIITSFSFFFYLRVGAGALLVGIMVDWAYRGQWGYVILDAICSLVILRGLFQDTPESSIPGEKK